MAIAKDTWMFVRGKDYGIARCSVAAVLGRYLALLDGFGGAAYPHRA
jgi:hypothetical protein